MEENRTEISSGRRFLFRILDGIEWLGNKLPSPLLLFAILAFIVVIISGIFAGVSVTNPTTGEAVEVKNLFSLSGLDYIFNRAVDNFIGFPPLGAVLVTMLGIGLAEQTGLINASLKGIVFSFPQKLLTAALVFAGVMSRKPQLFTYSSSGDCSKIVTRRNNSNDFSLTGNVQDRFMVRKVSRDVFIGQGMPGR